MPHLFAFLRGTFAGSLPGKCASALALSTPLLLNAEEAAPAVATETVAPVLNSGDTAWILACCALVLFMTLPGLALFYGGLVKAKNILSILVQCFAIAAVMSIVWVICGYSLAFTEGNAIIGGWSQMGLLGISEDTLLDLGEHSIPLSTHAMFQMTFFIITPALIVGGVAERMKFSALIIFCALWGLLCYVPICHMAWGEGGYLFEMGLIDLAGGTVVHITAGVAALVACLMVGKRKGYPKEPFKPHNLTMTMCGTGMLWVGWFGFNGGSDLGANGSAGMAMLVTHISAATAAFVWMIIEYIRYGKPSALGIATGAIAGLATITPASGNVGPLGAIVIGTCATLGCYFVAVTLKNKLKFDDSLDAFGVHGVGGFIGVVLVAIFCSTDLGGSGFGGDNESIGQQLGTQLIGAVITVIWSLVVSFVLLFILKKTIGIRVTEDTEDLGLDLSEHDELGYIL